MRLEAGAEIDRYRVERVLGRGGMAEVYLVGHRTLGTLHALKVLNINSGAIRLRLVDEGRLQAQIRHPNLVAVTDVLDVHGAPGLLMEYVDGPSLEQWLLDHRPALPEAERLFLGILSAVQRAHQRGVVHRDLKPGNVLLATDEDGRLVPKVADFGLAKVLDADEGGRNLTRSGVAMGTPAYMAPEQIRDAKNVDERADVFALGAMLYELVCGRRAFPGDDLLEVLNAVASGRFAAPREHQPDLPPRVEKAVLGCMAVDRERRIPDCPSLAGVLSGVLDWAVVPMAPVGPTLAPFASMAASSSRTAATPTFALTQAGQVAAEPPSLGSTGAEGSLGEFLEELDRATAGAASHPHPAQAARTVLRAPPRAVAVDDGRPSVANTDSRTSLVVGDFGAPDKDEPQAQPAPLEPRSQRRWVVAVAGLALAGLVVLFVAGTAILVTWKPWGAEAPPSGVSPAEFAPPADAAPSAPPQAAPPTNDHSQSEPDTESRAAPPPTTSTPPAEEDAVVTFSGADAIVLDSGLARYRPDKVPPGRYRIIATFDGKEVPAGEVLLRVGEQVTIQCNADFQMCER